MSIYLDCNIANYCIDCDEIMGEKIIDSYKDIYYVYYTNETFECDWKIVVSDLYHNTAIKMTDKQQMYMLEHNLVGKRFVSNNHYWVVGEGNKWSILRKNQAIYIYANNVEKKMLMLNTVIRQINRASHLFKGTIFMHSASFSYNDNAYILCGEKGTGKTTLLMNTLLKLKNAKLVSNDVTLITKENEILPVYSGAMVSKKTLDLLHLDISKLEKSNKFYFDEESEKYYFSYNFFLEFLNISTVKRAHLCKIYLLNMDLNVHGVKIENIDRSLANKILEKQIISEDKSHSDFLGLASCKYDEYLKKAKEWLEKRDVKLVTVGDNLSSEDIMKIIN